jgi:hypothetical protein
MLGKTASNRRIDRTVTNFGYSGQQASYIYSQLGNALAAKPDILLLGPDFGTNGADNSAGTSGEVWANYGVYIVLCAQACRAAGVRMIACATLPQASTSSANTHIGIARQKQWLFGVGVKLGIEVVDTHSEMLDQATGYLSATYDSGDAVHPNNAGHAQLATLISNYLASAQEAVGKMPWPVAAGPGGLVANPLNIGANSNGWSLTALTGSTFAGTATDTHDNRVDADDLPAGRWHKVNCDASSAGGTLLRGTTSMTVVPGEVVWVYGWAKADGTGTASVVIYNSSAFAVAQTLLTLANGAASVPFSIRFTVPAGCTSLRPALSCVTTTGQNLNAYLGACDVVRPSYLNAQ